MSIYSANFDPAHASIFDFSKSYGKEVVWIVISFLVACLILLLDSRFFPTFAYGFYILTLFSLIAVLFFGKLVNGNRAWFEWGSFRLQPAEFAKLCTCLALAKFLGGTNARWQDLNTRLIAMGILAVPFALIMLQDPGSALTFTALIFVLYREGLPGWVLMIALIGITFFIMALLVKPLYILYGMIAFALILYFTMRRTRENVGLLVFSFIFSTIIIFTVPFVIGHLKPHQRVRVNNLVGKDINLKGNYYNVNQSQIAIGSGRFFGKGFLRGTQTKFEFVPEQTTDFIWCTVGEEWGFLGCAVVIGLYLTLLFRILVLAERQRDGFGRIYGYGIASLFFFHILVNIGMTIGLVPVIGIPLPFLSYGGSSLLSFTIMLFILLRHDSSRTFLR
jgi:rod shape determining protein RodA